MSNRLINIVQALDPVKVKTSIKARGFKGVNVKPLLFIVADKTNEKRLGAGMYWSQKKMAKMLGCSKRNIKMMQDAAEAIGLLDVTPRKVEGGRDKPNILVLTSELLSYIDEVLLEDIGETVAGITEWVQQLPALDETVAGSGCTDYGEVGATVAAETKYSKPKLTQEGEAKAFSLPPVTGNDFEDLAVTKGQPRWSAGTSPRPVRHRAAGAASPECSHSYGSPECPHCLAKQDCKLCRGHGLKVIKAPTKQDPMHETQVVCDCTGLLEGVLTT